MQQLERELETLLEMTNRIANENEAALVDTLQQNSQAILWFGLLATAGFILLAQWIIRTILRPLNAMRTTAENSSQDLDLTRRCQIKGQDEIARTAQAFNHLLDTISHSFAVIVKEGDSVNRVQKKWPPPHNKLPLPPKCKASHQPALLHLSKKCSQVLPKLPVTLIKPYRPQNRHSN